MRLLAALLGQWNVLRAERQAVFEVRHARVAHEVDPPPAHS